MRLRFGSILLFAILSISASISAQSPPPVFTAEDMLNVQTFAGGQPVAVAPTGQAVAYVLTDLGDEWNIQERQPTGHLVVQAISGGKAGTARALTPLGSATHGSFPVWSPDGSHLAFVREDAAGGRLVVWNAGKDELTPIGESFSPRASLPPQWDSSGQRIVFAMPVDVEKQQPSRVRVVKSTDERIPGDQFFVDDRQALLVAADLRSNRVTLVLADPIVLRSFKLSPDSRHLIYTAPAKETLGIIGKERNESFVVSLDGELPAKPRKLPAVPQAGWSPDGRLLFVKNGKLQALALDAAEPAPFLPELNIRVSGANWSPDGSSFLALVPDPSLSDPEIEPPQPGMFTLARPFFDLYLVSAADGTARNLTQTVEDQISDPVWSPDGESVFFRAVHNQSYNETIYRYSVAGQKLQMLTTGEESYGSLAAAGGFLAATIEDATHPDDLYLFDVSSGTRNRVTTLNPQLAKFRFSKPSLFYYFNADGERLGALLYKPNGLPPEQKIPVITWIYEKMTPGIHRFNARDQMVISHGYGILMPNVKVKVGEPADSFYRCVVPAVNAVREMGFTNGRFGLWGHSFGAYATSNLITRTDIFAAAVSGATPPELFRNWASGRDRDSRNIESGQARMGGSPFVYPERYLSQSAFFHLDKVHTPVLILHGEKDLTILFGEGEMMFYALRQLGKTAEFVAYANGDHSLSRHSRQDALDVNRRILEWFDRYLQPAARN